MREGSSGDFEQREKRKERKTPWRLRRGMRLIVDMFCKEFSVKGKEDLQKELREKPNAKFVVAASHFSNLDAPAVVAALGDDLDIQVTAASDHFDFLTVQNLFFLLAGKDNFSPLSYEDENGSGRGVFNPDNFVDIAQKVEEGKTPWMAIHPFAKDEKMKKAAVGAVYLAHKSGAMIIPAALDYEGGSVSLEGNEEIKKAFDKRKEGKGTYHVGKPIQLLPLDVSIIEHVLDRRLTGFSVSNEEKQLFLTVMRRLRQDADTIANKIASMLPEERKGLYKKEVPDIELTEEDIERIGDL
jgi:hypothetical protein